MRGANEKAIGKEKRVEGLLERGGCRGELKCPHFLTGRLHKEPGGTLHWGGGFFCLGLPSIPTPQLSEVTPPVTLPRLFPVAPSALIVADWLNGENQNGGAGGGKKWKRKRRRVRIWEKGWQG